MKWISMALLVASGLLVIQAIQIKDRDLDLSLKQAQIVSLVQDVTTVSSERQLCNLYLEYCQTEWRLCYEKR